MNATNGTNDVTKNGVLEIAEAPKNHLWGSICIIWGYLFGGLGLGFVRDIIQIEVPCVGDMVGGHECHS